MKEVPMYRLWIPAIGKGKSYRHAMSIGSGPITGVSIRRELLAKSNPDVVYQVRRWDGTIVGTPMKVLPLP